MRLSELDVHCPVAHQPACSVQNISSSLTRAIESTPEHGMMSSIWETSPSADTPRLCQTERHSYRYVWLRPHVRLQGVRGGHVRQLIPYYRRTDAKHVFTRPLDVRFTPGALSFARQRRQA
jgi:hypothetical protein